MRRVAAAALVLVLLSVGGAFWLYRQYDAPGPLPEAANLVVPRGGLDAVAASLAQQDVITRPLLPRPITARFTAVRALLFFSRAARK